MTEEIGTGENFLVPDTQTIAELFAARLAVLPAGQTRLDIVAFKPVNGNERLLFTAVGPEAATIMSYLAQCTNALSDAVAQREDGEPVERPLLAREEPRKLVLP